MEKADLQDAPDMTEGALQALVEQAFRLAGWLVFHARDSRRWEPGFPDIVAVKAPWVVFAELKASSGKVKARAARSTRRELPTQRDWLTSLGACDGVETYLWKPEDWEQILQVANRPQVVEKRQEEHMDKVEVTIVDLGTCGCGATTTVADRAALGGIVDVGRCDNCGQLTVVSGPEGDTPARFSTALRCAPCRIVHPVEPEPDIPAPSIGCC